MAAVEQADGTGRILKWLTLSVVFFLVALIGIITALASDASRTVIFVLFGVLLVPAVLVLPVWAVWGLGDEDGH